MFESNTSAANISRNVVSNSNFNKVISIYKKNPDILKQAVFEDRRWRVPDADMVKIKTTN
ncbi:hypothetical protein O9993_03340 [Vibrio lentus]|nr:hypothetical protein [Vibrio lentus]